MVIARRFEYLECWKDARKLVNMIYDISSRDNFRKDYGLRDQIQRAGVSVMSNIAEGFSAFSRHEFARFLSFPSRSASEVQSHLYAAIDRSYIPDDGFSLIYEQAEKCRSKCKSLIGYLQSSGKPKTRERENAGTRERKRGVI